MVSQPKFESAQPRQKEGKKNKNKIPKPKKKTGMRKKASDADESLKAFENYLIERKGGMKRSISHSLMTEQRKLDVSKSF